MLKKIYLVRHGESVGNVDKSIYKTCPDHAVKLTEKGEVQAISAGKDLAKILAHSDYGVITSPFVRTLQTTNLILSELSKVTRPEFVRENASIREQEWQSRFGDESSMSLAGLNTKADKARIKFGIFFYRFDSGESCADVYDRCKTFINEIMMNRSNLPRNLVVVTHGMTMRILVMAMFNKSVKEFETWIKPNNCEMWEILSKKVDDTNSEFFFNFDVIRKRKIKNTHQIDITNFI